MAYTTLATVKSELGISNTDDDTLLAALIVTAQALIEAPAPLGTGRVFEVSTNTAKTFDALRDVEGRTLWLMPFELASINTVTNGDGTVIDSAYYTTEPRGATPYRGITLKAGAPVYWNYTDYPEDAISISGKWGYSTSASAAVQHLATRLTMWLYRQRESSTADQAIQTEVGIILPARLPNDIQLMMRALRPIL